MYVDKGWTKVADQVVSGMACEVLHHNTVSSITYRWISVDTGNTVQELKVPHRRRQVLYGIREHKGKSCKAWFRNKNDYVCLNDFIPCTPHYAKALTFDRQLRLNDTTSFMYDNSQLYRVSSSVTVATLIEYPQS
jgi:hypothetical protein